MSFDMASSLHQGRLRLCRAVLATTTGALLLTATPLAARAGNNWSIRPPAPRATAPAPEADAAPTYIDRIPGSAPVQVPLRRPDPAAARDQYAPRDLEQRLSGVPSARAIAPLLQPTPSPRRAPPRSAPLNPPVASASPYASTGGAFPYVPPALPYGLPYGGVPGGYPLNNSGFGPFGGGQPQGGFPSFGFSPFGFF